MSKVEALRQALRRLLTEHERDGMLPRSGRFLFYEFIQAAIIPKHATVARRADQNMIDALTSLRESGEIPRAWIVDETCGLEGYSNVIRSILGMATRR
jgi:hypothetical protein